MLTSRFLPGISFLLSGYANIAENRTPDTVPISVTMIDTRKPVHTDLFRKTDQYDFKLKPLGHKNMPPVAASTGSEKEYINSCQKGYSIISDSSTSTTIITQSNTLYFFLIKIPIPYHNPSSSIIWATLLVIMINPMDITDLNSPAAVDME